MFWTVKRDDEWREALRVIRGRRRDAKVALSSLSSSLSSSSSSVNRAPTREEQTERRRNENKRKE